MHVGVDSWFNVDRPTDFGRFEATPQPAEVVPSPAGAEPSLRARLRVEGQGRAIQQAPIAPADAPRGS